MRRCILVFAGVATAARGCLRLALSPEFERYLDELSPGPSRAISGRAWSRFKARSTARCGPPISFTRAASGILPVEVAVVHPIARQALSTAAPGTGGAATFGSPVIITGDDTGEPGIHIAPDGTIYVNAPAGFLSSLPGSASFVYRSTDGGSTWVKTPAGLRGL